MLYDIVIVGGGPSGLSAALALGRARRTVLLCDSGPRRNATAQHINNFLTRDGTPPDELRGLARQQLGKYPNVSILDQRVESITGSRGHFIIALASGVVRARRVLLCTGMIDEMLPIEGFRELWGRSIFQCPYCHGWEVQDRRWGYLAHAADVSRHLPFALMLRGWSREVSVFLHEPFEVPQQTVETLNAAGVAIERSPVARLVTQEDSLIAIELADRTSVPCDVLFAHPPQRQVDVVRALEISVDDDGYVRVNDMKRETSISGIYAAGDLTTRGQGAMLAAAAGVQAAAAINADLMMELASEPLATPPASRRVPFETS